MSNDLVAPADLADEPGAPFTDDEVDSAAATLQSSIGWHIAPERSDTVTFDVSSLQAKLRLPTRHLVSIDEVREDGVVVTGYTVSTNLGIVLKTDAYWTEGYGMVEVDMTHGYSELPLDLVKVVAAIASTSRRDQTVREAAAGPYILPIVGIEDIICRYRPLQNRVGIA